MTNTGINTGVNTGVTRGDHHTQLDLKELEKKVAVLEKALEDVCGVLEHDDNVEENTRKMAHKIYMSI